MNNLSQLKWVSVQSSTDPEIFELKNGENQIMSLSFNHTDQTVKIECDESRRYFHIEKEGLLFNKIILKNEYGIKIGEIAHELWFNKEGFIELNEEHFHYSIQNAPTTQFTIYGRSKKKTPLLICGLDINDGKNSLNLSKPEEENKEIYSLLLVALCWFLFTPIAKENLEPVTMNA